MNRFIRWIAFLMVVALVAGGNVCFAANHAFVQNSGIVTNVKSPDELVIEFQVNAAYADGVRYEVYFFSGTRPAHRTLVSSPVATGTCEYDGRVRIQVPNIGNYYIRTENRMAYDDDYVFVNYKDEKLSEKYVWTQHRIDEYEAKRKISDLIYLATGEAIEFAVKKLAGDKAEAWIDRFFTVQEVIEIISDTTDSKDIRFNPEIGCAWQYVFKPGKGECKIYLRQFDSAGNVVGKDAYLSSIKSQ